MPVERLFPVQAGMRMIYVVSMLGRPTGQLTQAVLGVRRNRGALLARVQRHLSGNDPEHFAVAVAAGEVRVDNQVVLRSPLTPNQSWTGGTANDPAELVVIATDAVAAVPAGRYTDCVAVSTCRGGVEEAATWYAPGVGMVMHRFRVPGGWGELALAGREDGN